MNDIEKILQSVKNNSIGVEKKEKLKTGKKQVSQKAILVATVLAVSLSLCSCSLDFENDTYHNYNNENNFTHSQEYIDYNEGKHIVVNKVIKVMDIFNSYGIDITKTIEEEFDVYKQIKEINEEDLIAYYEILGEQECEKVLKVLGYENWTNYLIEKGQPSISNWLHDTYVSIGETVEIGGYTK